ESCELGCRYREARLGTVSIRVEGRQRKWAHVPFLQAAVEAIPRVWPSHLPSGKKRLPATWARPEGMPIREYYSQRNECKCDRRKQPRSPRVEAQTCKTQQKQSTPNNNRSNHY